MSGLAIPSAQALTTPGAIAAHAELIPPPYVPQVGDIVEVTRKTQHHPPIPVGTLLRVKAYGTHPDGKSYAMVTHNGMEFGFADSIEPVARPGEVYQP